MIHDPEIVRRLLERDLIDAANPAELRLVWADLLQLDGDRLGTLVVLDHVRTSEGTPPAIAKQAAVEAAALRRELGPRLWDAPLPDPLPGVTLTWQLGYVRELDVELEQLSNADTPMTTRWERGRLRSIPATEFETLAWLLPRLLRQPAMRWLEVIRIDVDDEFAHQAIAWLSHVSLDNPVLREIHVGRPAAIRLRPGGSWEPRPATWMRTPVVASLAQLRWISIAGELVRLPCCDGNPQTRVHYAIGLADRRLTSANQAALVRALWDASTLVQQAAFECARKLGPRAEFLIADLARLLRPPLSRTDPRPLAALQTLAAIGPASAHLVTEVVAQPDALLTHNRVLALLGWLAALGPAASPAQPLLDQLVDGIHGALPATANALITRIRLGIAKRP